MSIRKLIAVIPGLVAATIVATATAPSAAAQGGVELTPWVGAYIPTSNDFPRLTDDFSRNVSGIGGARLTFWGSRNLGFEVTGGYSPAKVAGETVNEANTNLLRGQCPAAPGAYAGHQQRRRVRGRRWRAADPWQQYLRRRQSSTDLGGHAWDWASASAVATITGSGFRLDIEDYLYNGDFGGGDDFQNDLVTSLGVSIALGGKAGD